MAAELCLTGHRAATLDGLVAVQRRLAELRTAGAHAFAGVVGRRRIR